MVGLIRYINKIFKRPIALDDPLRFEPISRIFGLERGMPIDRYYIEQFLNSNRNCVHGAVLEISESVYSKKFGKDVTSYEILHYDNSNKKATIVGDLTKFETLPANRIDCFICTQTLNFIYDVRKAVEGSYKLLRIGGVFLGTVSGISQISRYDMDRWGDYWRFTDLSVLKLMESVFGMENVEVTVYGNALAATAFIQGLALSDIPDTSLLDRVDKDYQVTIGFKATKK